jgi:hypothetical protein
MEQEAYNSDDISSGFLIDGKYRIYPTNKKGELLSFYVDLSPSSLILSTSVAKMKVLYSVREWGSDAFYYVDANQYLKLLRYALTTFGGMSL